MRTLFLYSAIGIILIMSLADTYASGSDNTAERRLMSLSGQVFDYETGESLPGVMIKIDEYTNPVYTDLDGRFEIAGLEPGDYKLKTSLISYEVAEMDLNLNTEEAEPVEVGLSQISLK